MDTRPTRVETIRIADACTADLRHELAACWAETVNAGGAVGFPFPPVSIDDTRPAIDELVAGIADGTVVLVVAHDEDGVAGWVCLDGNTAPLVAHWATIRRLQSRPRARGRGIGAELMRHVVEVAREEGLESLHLAVRSGMGLEGFYERLGWQVVGRWPDALRLAGGDRRDEIQLFLDLTTDAAS